MHRFLVVTCFAIFCSVQLSFGQADRAKVLAETITQSALKKHVKTLSADEMEGRETASAGQKKAAVYIMQQFIKQEINPLNGGYFQRFSLNTVHPSKIELSINDQQLSFFKEYLHYSNFNNVKTSTKNAIFIGYGEELSLNDSRFGLQNQTVFMLAHRKDGDKESLQNRVNQVSKKGVKVVFVVENEVDFTQHYLKNKKQFLATDTFEFPVPVLYVSKQWADSTFKASSNFKLNKWLKRKKKKNVRLALTVELNVETIDESGSSENVYAFIEGDELKDEVIVLLAHYDHLGLKGKEVYNGADDNASGTAALIEMAEAFNLAKEMGGGIRRSVLILLVSGEEKGLLGSKYYCQNPFFSFDQTKAVLNIDMIGRTDQIHQQQPNYLYIIGSDFISPDLHRINEEQNQKYSNLTLDYRYNSKNDPNRFYFRSDHYPFAMNGVPAIFYFSGIHQDYHRTTDTYDKIDFPKLELLSRHIFYTAWRLVNQKEGLKKQD